MGTESWAHLGNSQFTPAMCWGRAPGPVLRGLGLEGTTTIKEKDRIGWEERLPPKNATTVSLAEFMEPLRHHPLPT